jgi:hypothetical protein
MINAETFFLIRNNCRTCGIWYETGMCINLANQTQICLRYNFVMDIMDLLSVKNVVINVLLKANPSIQKNVLTRFRVANILTFFNL